MVSQAFGINSGSLSLITTTNVTQTGNTLPQIIYVSSSLNDNTSGMIVGTNNTPVSNLTYQMGSISHFSGSVCKSNLDYYKWPLNTNYFRSIFTYRQFIAASK